MRFNISFATDLLKSPIKNKGFMASILPAGIRQRVQVCIKGRSIAKTLAAKTEK